MIEGGGWTSSATSGSGSPPARRSSGPRTSSTAPGPTTRTCGPSSWSSPEPTTSGPRILEGAGPRAHRGRTPVRRRAARGTCAPERPVRPAAIRRRASPPRRTGSPAGRSSTAAGRRRESQRSSRRPSRSSRKSWTSSVCGRSSGGLVGDVGDVAEVVGLGPRAAAEPLGGRGDDGVELERGSSRLERARESSATGCRGPTRRPGLDAGFVQRRLTVPIRARVTDLIGEAQRVERGDLWPAPMAPASTPVVAEVVVVDRPVLEADQAICLDDIGVERRPGPGHRERPTGASRSGRRRRARRASSRSST